MDCNQTNFSGAGSSPWKMQLPRTGQPSKQGSSPDWKMAQSCGFSFQNHHEGDADVPEPHAGSLQAAPAPCWCIHVPAAPESYWGYSSGLVPQGVTMPSLPFTLPAGVVVSSPGKPHNSMAGVNRVWWSSVQSRGAMPHQCLASSPQSTVHASFIFGSVWPGAQDMLGAQDTASLLLNPCEFPVAGEALA